MRPAPLSPAQRRPAPLSLLPRAPSSLVRPKASQPSFFCIQADPMRDEAHASYPLFILTLGVLRNKAGPHCPGHLSSRAGLSRTLPLSRISPTRALAQ
ncbi:hypothetical protein EV1_014301 [Malus domestica]